MVHRIATGGAFGLAVLFLLGSASFLYGSESWGWAEFSEGWWWYSVAQFQGHWFLIGLLLITLLISLVYGGVAFHGRRLFRRAREKVNPLAPPKMQQQRDRLLRRKLLFMDREFCQPHPQPDKLVDTLFGCVVDLGAQSLRLVPGPKLVELVLHQEEQDHPLTTITFSVYQLILDQLRRMLELSESGVGKISLRSSQRVDPLQIRIQPEALGFSTLIEASEYTTDPGPPDEQVGITSESRFSRHGAQASRTRKRSITLARMERRRRADLITGEFPIPFSGEEDTTDSHVALMLGMDPSSENEIAPVVKRKVKRPLGPTEQWLRLALIMGLNLSVLLYFWEALGWGGHHWVTQEVTAPWRNVAIEIRSLPRPGTVSIEGKDLGQTPVKITLPCRGTKLEVVVRAQGFMAWQWSGICPTTKQLSLLATLQPY